MLHSFLSNWNNIAASVWAALFNSLPAVCILTGVVWLLLERVKEWSAATRYAGWCGMLAIGVVLPVTQFVQPHRAVAVGINVVEKGKIADHRYGIRPIRPQAADVDREWPFGSAALWVGVSGSATNAPPLVMRIPAEREKLTAGGGILLFWGLAMLVQLARLGVALRHQFVLKRSSFEPDREMSARWVELLGHNRDVRRPVRLAISSRITMPAVVGYRRPVILVPGSLARRLTGEQIDSILLHELAHVRRWDDWAIAVQRFLQAVLALHPLIHLITSKMELQREIACDDWVLRTQQARVYASSLTEVAECCLRPAHSGLMGLAMENQSQFGERVALLLDSTRSVTTRVSGRWLGSFVSILGLACFASLQLPAVMAFPAQAAVTPTPPVASKELAREEAELSAKQQELGRKQAELMKQQMQLAHTQMARAQAQMQQKIKMQLDSQMQRLREQLSHMNLDETTQEAGQVQYQAAELASVLANLQALSAFSRDDMTGKWPLSKEEMAQIRKEQERYRTQAAVLAKQQAQAAKEFSERLNTILKDALGQESLISPTK